MQPDPASGALLCRHCGTLEDSPTVVRHLERVGPSSTACPTCATPMADSRLEGHPLLFCERCHGMLVPMAHFVAVIEAARAHEERARVMLPRRQNPGDRVLACPLCGQPMLSHFYSGPGNLVIDTCERCHVNWLDPGELRRIARAPQGRIWSPPPAPPPGVGRGDDDDDD
jgi:Zn-finger nucleic acid-binding protein